MQRRTAASLTWTLLLLPILACQPGTEPASDAEGELRAASAAWDQAHNAGDLARLMDFYADSAVSMPYDRPALAGRAAILADFEAFFAEFEPRHRTDIVALDVAGDLAVERGRYTFSARPKVGGAGLEESGKHLVVRRRVAGGWKIVWEIWNRDSAGGP